MWSEKSKLLKDKIRFLKNLGQHSAQKIGKKTHIINNNRLVNNHSTRPRRKIEKGKKFEEKEMSLQLKDKLAMQIYEH